MTLSDATSYAAIGAPLLTFFGAIWYGLAKLNGIAIRFAKLELKVETMWVASNRFGIIESIKNDRGTMNSPVTPSDEALLWMEPLAVELHESWQKGWKTLDDADLMLAIEHKFGDRIMREVCIPYGISNSEGRLIAAYVARNGPR
jgi:hypothetical protein